MRSEGCCWSGVTVIFLDGCWGLAGFKAGNSGIDSGTGSSEIDSEAVDSGIDAEADGP